MSHASASPDGSPDQDTGGATHLAVQLEQEVRRRCPELDPELLPDGFWTAVAEAVEATSGHRTGPDAPSDGGDLAETRAVLRQREQQLSSQPPIEQVKGMLKQDFDMTDEQAIRYLKRMSQDTNVKVRELAGQLVDELSGSASTTTASATAHQLKRIRNALLRRD
ncbi:MAG TPA: ANTAR domain-containing protein [Marmoricola sp.]|nr:ANTAR domain-containing protein [Marmoricola sp.]